MMINANGYAIISHILKKIPASCLSPKLVEELDNAYRAAALNEKLQVSLLKGLLLDFTPWIYASPDTQHTLLRVLKEYVRSGQRREYITASLAFRVLRLFYWEQKEEEGGRQPLKKWELCAEPRLSTQTKEVIGTRPPRERIREIRRGLYGIIHTRFAGEDAVVPKDIDAFVDFLSGYYEPDMATEIIRSLCGTLFDGNAKSTAEAFVTKNGLVELIRAFDVPHVPLQVASIEMITRLNDVMLESNLRHARLDMVAILIRQRLSLQPPIGMHVCNALFHMSIRPDPVARSVFISPSILVLCLFPLLAVPGVALDVRNATLKDFSELLAAPLNAEKFLQCPGWEVPLAHFVEAFAEACAERRQTTAAARLVASVLFSLSKYSILSKSSVHNVETFFGLLRAAEARSANRGFFVMSRSLYFDALSQFLAAMKKGAEHLSYALFYVIYTINSLVYMEDSTPEYALQDADTLVNIVAFFDKCSVTLSNNWEGYERWKSSSSSGAQIIRTRPGGFLSESTVALLRVFDLLSIALNHVNNDNNNNNIAKDTLNKIKTFADFSVTHLAEFSNMFIPWMGAFQAEYYHIFARSVEVYKKFPRGSEPEKALKRFIFTLAEKVCEKKRYKRFLPESTEGSFQLFAGSWSNDPDAALAELGWGVIISEIKKRALPFENYTIAANFKNASVYFKKLAGDDALAAEKASVKAVTEMTHTSVDGIEDESARRCREEEARLEKMAQKIRVRSAEGAHEWRNLMRALTAGNGPWGTAEAVPNWKLDKTENRARMRLKMKRNYAFTSQHKSTPMMLIGSVNPLASLPPVSPLLPQPQQQPLSPTLTPTPPSLYSMSDIANSQRKSLLTANWLQLLNAVPVRNVASANNGKDAYGGDGYFNDDDSSNNNEKDDPKDSTNNGGGTEPLGKGVIYSGACELIRPGRIINGQLSVVSQSGVHFLESADDRVADGGAVKRRKKVFWAAGDIKEVHVRRYLLSYTALEIFFHDCTNVFINFTTNAAMKSAYSKITKGLKPPRLAFTSSRSPKDILQSSGLTERWVNGEISNFDYLMELNTIAGRTYNDLRQYPVFPWVIADYKSERLDLSNPKTFRDLSKPVGALTPKRLNEFRTRYEHLKRISQELPPDDETNTPPFMYGTHYSSADSVFFYLIRTEPFTTHFLRLQRHLDIPDRMFNSVEVAWHNCLYSTCDIKELVPEFFYFPDFLRNSNGYDFGKLQTGEPLGDVVLPPWAHGSPEEFVRINREALESEYASAHLHEWIDLIFGYKQRGEEAVKADNLFCYFTYEGAVDLSKITDERTRVVMRDQIANFGQTPSQLFTTPHPRRAFAPRSSVWLETVMHASLPLQATSTSRHRSLTLAASGICTKWSATVSLDGSPLVFAAPAKGKIITVSASRILCAHGFTGVNGASDPDSVARSGNNNSSSNNNNNIPPFTLTVNNKANNGSAFRVFGTSFDEKIAPAISSQLFSVSASGKHLFSCGFWDGSFKIVDVETRMVLLSVRKHNGIVTCVKYAQQKNSSFETGTLVTGSTDTTVMTWNVDPSDDSMNPIKQSPNVLYGHNDEITALDASSDFDIVASGDKSGCLVVHTLRRGGFVWSAPIPKVGSISSVKISPANGCIYVYSKECSMITAFDINGHPLCVAEKCGDAMNDFCVTNDGRTLLSCSASSPYIWIWDAYSLVLLQKIRMESPVVSLSISDDDVLIIAGMKNGNLLIISPKDTRTKKKI